MEITLRPLRVADADVIARWFTDPVDLAQWAGPDIDFPLTRKHFETWVGEHSGGRSRACYATLGSAFDVIGTFQLVHDAKNRAVRISRFGIAPEQRGNGFGRNLLAFILAKAFDELEAHRIELQVSTENLRARRLYERAGFVHEGTARESCYVDGVWRSSDTMSLLRAEWQPAWEKASSLAVA
jgi:RimJ/RimL family protein N-acetyltransferase